MAEKKSWEGVNRRDFIKGTVAGAGAVAAMGLGAVNVEAKPITPKKWNKEADVVILGYGGAGACAAIEAHDAGAKVLILEKMKQSGGNTGVSGGGFLCPTNAADAYTYITGLYEFSHSDMDKDLVRVYANESIKNVEWIKSLQPGTDVLIYGGAGYRKVPGAKSMNKYHVKGEGKGLQGSSKNLWKLLTYAVEEKRKIPVMLETPAQQLVTNSKGEVVGVIAKSKGKEISIRAKRAVIMTTGGYEYNEKDLQNFVKGYPIYALGSPGNTGDGLRMAQKVGAGLWHMNGMSCPLGIKTPDIEAAFPATIVTPRHIMVDKHGNRFVNEKAVELHAGLLAVDHFDTHVLEYPRIPCYVIFDETARKAGPITALAGMGYAGRQHKWSADNSVEIEKGWILKGGTLAELAGKIKTMDKATLEKAVAKWNEDMAKGADTVFHRPIRSGDPSSPAYKELATALWSAPIDTPPFYAVELYPALLNTQGGPRKNNRAQMLDAFEKPIPRLYSAGEFGSMWGIIYQGAGNIGECIVYGRIAGKNAAAEKPWK
ncbi:MAG: FAD-binding protein [Syntrophales bacterium]|jgi:succinate dehydrogenase/fumarate reductase flavoprotein subunit|nr:FAD-binding protein [Syntrophales bacterium]MCK9390303.1 FAD-binding protein [Syntrophales bacterium]